MLRDGHHSATGSVRRYNHTFSKTPALRLAMTEVWAGDDSSGPPGRLVVRCRLWPQGGGLVSTETGPVSPPRRRGSLLQVHSFLGRAETREVNHEEEAGRQ